MSEKVARMAVKAAHSPLFGDGWDAFAVAPCAALRGKSGVRPIIYLLRGRAGFFNA